MLLSRNGYDPQQMDLGDMESLSRCMAWFYNYHALGRGFYPGVVETLQRLRDQNIRLGILSNAQFYTPIDLTLFLRDEAGDRYDDYLELFDIDLVYYSYEHGAAKPSHALYRRLFDGLYELHILPMDTVLVGNDLAADIAPAAEAGLKTAFFAGDNTSALTHDLGGSVVPDITFLSWYELSERISFYEEKKAQ
jgi:putative hydrolase of the HAD superfamily